MLTLENGSPPRQPISMFPLMEFQDLNSKHESLSELDIESLLMLQSLVKTEQMYAKEFEEAIRLTRAPVQMRLRRLTALGLVNRQILPGTESKYRPTYIYTPASWLSEDLLMSRIVDKSKPLTKPQTQKQEAQEPKEMVDAISNYENQMQVMAELLEIAIDRIAELEDRLGRLERLSNTAISLDRDELLRKLRGKKS